MITTNNIIGKVRANVCFSWVTTKNCCIIQIFEKNKIFNNSDLIDIARGFFNTEINSKYKELLEYLEREIDSSTEVRFCIFNDLGDILYSIKMDTIGLLETFVGTASFEHDMKYKVKRSKLEQIEKTLEEIELELSFHPPGNFYRMSTVQFMVHSGKRKVKNTLPKGGFAARFDGHEYVYEEIEDIVTFKF